MNLFSTSSSDAGGATATALDRNNTIPRVLVRQAERYGAKPLISFPYESAVLTYEGLVEQAESASTRLRLDHGMQAGDMAAIYLGNSVDCVKAWFSCLFGGMIDVPVNHEFKKSLLLFALTTVQAKAVFTDGEGVTHLVDEEVRGYLIVSEKRIVEGLVLGN